jgi:hypothetical protein
VDVTAFGTARAGDASYLEEADTTTFAWVGTQARARPPAARETANVVFMIMRPGARDEASMDTPAREGSTWAARHSVFDSAVAYAAPPADAYGYQSIISPDPDPRYDPNVAADGADLGNVPVTAGVSGAEPDPCKVFPQWIKHVSRTQHTWAYTKIGEYHSNWDAQGSYNYTAGATTSVGAYLSVDGDHYSLDGSVEYDNSKAVEIGILSGQFSSYQQVLALKYQKVKWWWTPPGYPDSVICKSERFIRETGFYNPRHGFVYIKNGASVWKGWDGIQGWRQHGKPQYWNGFTAGRSVCVSVGSGYMYHFGAAVWGIGVQADTAHTIDSEQCIQFGDERRYNLIRHKKSGLHELWGDNAPVAPPSGPQIFYNY